MKEPPASKVQLPAPVRLARWIRHSAPLRKMDPLWGALRPAYRRLLGALGGRSGVAVEVAGLGKLRLPASFLQEDVPQGEFPALTELLRSLQPGHVFYDVGASVGMYSFFALNRLGAGGAIHAFEPDPASCQVLTGHLATLQPPCPVRLNRCFVGDTTTPGMSPADVEWSGARPQTTEFTRHRYLFEQQDAAIAQQFRLDDYVASGQRPPDMIKCDIEGAELLMLRGAESTLRRHGPVLIVSVHPTLLLRFGQTLEEVEQFLKSAGYTIRLLNDDGELHWLCTSTTRA